jgi:hypothetical protein
MKTLKAVVLLFLIFCLYDCKPNLVKIKEMSFKGVIRSKFKTGTGCFGSIVINENNRIDTLTNICYCGAKNTDVWDFCVPGDTIYKEKNIMTINVIRNRIVKRFDYPLCYQ